MANEIEEQDTSQEPVGEEETQEPQGPAGPSLEDQIAQLKKTNQGLYERLKKAEAELKEKKGEAAKPEVPEKPKEASNILSEAKDYARLIAQGYTDEEISFLEKYKGDRSILEVAKDLDASIKAMREQKKVVQGTPAPSAPSQQVPKPKSPTEETPQDRANKFWDLVNRGKQKSFE